jgi:hypothetical protein
MPMDGAAMPVAEAAAAAAEYLRMPAADAVLTRAAETALALAEAFCGEGLDRSALPAPVMQGVVLLAAHLFEHRDASAAPPAAVAALWRPYRRLRLLAEGRP